MSQYPWLLLVVYVAAVGVVQLLAIWAATSRRPWLLRALAVWTPIALLAAIRVHEPALVLLASAVLTIGLSFAVQRVTAPRELSDQPKRRFWRFSLGDMLVLMLLLATWLGITTRNVPPSHHLRIFLMVTLVATPPALLTLFVQRAVTGPKRVRATLLALSVIWIGALVLRVSNVGLHLGDGPSSLNYGLTSGSAYLVGLQGSVLTGLAICLAIPLSVWRGIKNKPASHGHRLILSLAIGAASTTGILLAWLAWEIVNAETLKRLRIVGAEIAIHSIFFFALAGFIALGIWLARACWGETTGWQRRAARAAAVSLLVLAIPPMAWLYWQMLSYAPFPQAKRSPANHYDRIAEIARHVYQCQSNLPLPPNARSKLDEAVVLLRGPNYVPPHVRRNPAPDRDSALGRAGSRLWMRLQEAADSAVSKRQFDRAADYAIAMIRFEAMCDQGAKPTSGYWGYHVLMQHRDHFSDIKARAIIELLNRTLAELETPEYLVAQDRALGELFGGWRTKLKMNLARLKVKDGFDYSAYVEQINVRRRSIEAQNRLLQADLALRIYQRQHGQWPKSLADLSSDILPEMPLDPYTGRPLIYRPTDHGFLLYSVGLDGVDDGGAQLSLAPEGYVSYDMALPGP